MMTPAEIETQLVDLDARLGSIEYLAEKLEAYDARLEALEAGEHLERDLTADRLAQIEERLDALG